MDSYSLRSVSDLPPPFRSTFSFRYFNSLQSECFSECFLSDMNMVISAPTGSGKTVLFELCVLRLLSSFLTREGKFNHSKGVLKTIYIAPSKALVQEKLRDWNMKLGSLGVHCLEMTGDNEDYHTKNIQDADIILTTPEKFDAVTRHGIRGGGLSFFSDISLVLIDEVHLLNDSRGAALEAVVSRIKMLSRSTELKSSPLAKVRYLAVSATIPNIEDLAEWLLVPPQGTKRFGEEMRPVKLLTKVFGYAPARNDFLFERRLQNFIFDILMQHSRGKSALIFCSTRKGAQEAAQRLSQIAMSHGYSNPFIKSNQQQERLKEASLSFNDKQMQSCILYGVGYHNGGLCLKDRNLIEGLFLKGDVQILCTTNTLAHGVNLPAHTVVIKSTQYFNKEKGLYLEYDRSMILQMCGRAGRPPFDDTGTVIIMTRRETVHLYENLLSGCEMVESQLLSCATEHLNAEIVQLTVSDISLAIEWLKCSYLYVRIKKNPENYGIKRGIPLARLEKHMQEICVQRINELSKSGMIWTDEDGFLLKPLEPGRLMTKFYLKFDTMKEIVKAPESCSLDDALHIVCRSAEVSWIQLRRNEKKLLNDINVDKISRLRFHVLAENGKRKKRIQTREEKIFVLANDCLTGDPLVHDLSLNQDMNSICSNGFRIAKCMKECFFYRKSYKGALSSSVLAKCLHQRVWNDSPFLLKQLPGIGMVTAKALNSAGINSFETMAEADPRKIEIVTGRKYPFGNHIKESLLSLPPKVVVQIQEVESKLQGKSRLTVTLTRLAQPAVSNKPHYADMIVGSEEDNIILFSEKIRAEEFSSPYVATIFVSCPHLGKVTVKADLIFDEYVGVDVHEKYVVSREFNTLMTRKHGTEAPTSCYTLPKENYVVEDENNASLITTEEILDLNISKKAKSSMPSFDLLLEEETSEDASVPEPGEIDCKANTIFDHIRKKSKSFPALMASKAMDSSYEPLILTTKHTLRNRFKLDDSEVQGDLMVTIHSEPTVAYSKLKDKLTYPMEAGQCHDISGGLGCITDSDLSTKYAGTSYQQLKRKLFSDSPVDVPAVGCKRLSLFEPPGSSRQDDLEGWLSETIDIPQFDGHDAILLDSEPIEVSPKFSDALSSSTDAEGKCNTQNFIRSGDIVDLELSTKFAGAMPGQSDKNKLLANCSQNDLVVVRDYRKPLQSKSTPVSTRQAQHCFSFETRRKHDSTEDPVILIDASPLRSSTMFTVALSPVEARGPDRNTTRKIICAKDLESSTKSPAAVDSWADNGKLFSIDLPKDVPAVGCKRPFTSESNYAGEQDDRLPKGPLEASFLGFKSVFSFL